MAAGVDTEQFVRQQRDAIAGFFGVEVPPPPDRLFVIEDKIRQENLLVKPLVIYLPRRQLAQAVDLPGQSHKLSPVLYQLMREKLVAADADWLPGEYAIIDTTRSEPYNGGRQMYADTPRFKEVIAGLRDNGSIKTPREYSHVPKPSRVAISEDEIDGKGGFVARAIAEIVRLQEGEEVGTLLASTYNYVGNLYPEFGFGEVNIAEWFKNKFGRGGRLGGGNSDFDGLSDVSCWLSDDRSDDLGFRFQFGLPPAA